jgi:hypothetical protein
MSARDDLTRAAAEARAQVDDARQALTRTREARAGGPARDARQAEQQLHALRGAIADDLRSLRGRVGALDPSARRGARTAAVAGVTGLVGLVGAGLAARGTLRRGAERRSVRRQALALAAALADQVGASTGRTGPGATLASRPGRRRGPVLALLTVGAAVAVMGVAQQRRSAPIDPDDLWLPERTAGPA